MFLLNAVISPSSSRHTLRSTTTKEETNIQNSNDKNKSGQSHDMSRHRRSESLLDRLLRRLRHANWARHLHRHEQRQRRAARQWQRPAPPAFPPRLKTAWLKQVAIEHPGWKPGARGWRLAAYALEQFFDASAAAAPLSCALPSRAADLVWHLWIECDPEGLAAWQLRRYGRTVAHREHEPGEDNGASLARCLVRACRAEHSSPVRGALPLVFRVDRLLRTPWGWSYERFHGTVLHTDLNADGRPCGHARGHGTLMPAALVGFGLIGAREAGLAARERGEKGDKSGGSGCGSSCGSGSGDCGGGSGAGDGGGCG
ncbi:MAG: hypothetical protein EOP37_05155, partial [Rubrivivax sp.]